VSDIGLAIRERLGALAPESIELIDESGQHVGHAGYRPGQSTHFSLTIVSGRFDGLSRVQRHRLVYDTLGPLMQSDIHALAVKALTPQELHG
jgi:BolA protein